MSRCLYSCRPQRRIGAAIAVAAFFFCGAAAFSAVGLNNQLRRVFNLTALLMLVICFLIVKRFLATAYSYAVYSGESADLVIYEHTLVDKEPNVVCRIALSCITEVQIVREKKKRKKGKPLPRHNYAVSVFEREYVIITCSDDDELCEIKLTCDAGLLGLLENYCK